jgi:hypothetical protein
MPTEDPRYPADFDQATWEEDFARATDAGKLAGGNARRETGFRIWSHRLHHPSSPVIVSCTCRPVALSVPSTD